MELEYAIKQILNGDAIVLMGSGASYGAKNAFGDFPSGAQLAEDLYKKCSVVPDGKYDLQDASQCYIERFNEDVLISEIRSTLTCASFTQDHEQIYSLPWMRYYTTNYDDVALLAAKNQGVSITPVTLNYNLNEYKDNAHVCVHINGHIGNLNKDTLNGEFKLTSNSYMSQNYILDSQWGYLLANDLETANCIVIIGLSLQYDLDLRRIIYNSEAIEKTIIIDSPSLSENAENRLGRYGTVYKIGVNGFASHICEVKKTHVPPISEAVDKLYTGFKFEQSASAPLSTPLPIDIFKLFINGQCTNTLFHKTNEFYDGFINREQVDAIETAVISNKRYIFIHSDMGNGKTACVTELKYRLLQKGICVFTLTNPDSSKLAKEIFDICSINRQIVVVIEDYTNYMEILRMFSVHTTSNIRFVLTARTALNQNKMPELIARFDIAENESAVIDVNSLESENIQQCIRIFNKHGLFGRMAGQSDAEKYRYLKSRKGGNSQFQSIMLGVLESDVLHEKIVQLIDNIENKSLQYHKSVILILLTQLMKLRISIHDIERITAVDIQTDATFRSNTAIQELIDYDESSFVVKSPTTAKYILSKVSKPETIIAALFSLAEFASTYSDSPKYFSVLTAVISYSHLNSFFRDFDNSEELLTNYYDSVSGIDYYSSNHFFWLQYAISCIEVESYQRAQKYLDTAYGLIPKNFNPFQINNQQARLYLEKIVTNKSTDVLEDYKAAHKLLMLPITSVKDNEYNVVRLFGYYCRKKFRDSIVKNDCTEFHKQACGEAYTRIASFLKHSSTVYRADLNELKNNLLIEYAE